VRILSINLKNFQGHKSLKLDFSRHITTIRGQSDVGKSAILRAIQWACLNNSPGGDFVHHGAKQAEVELIIDIGTKKSPVAPYRIKRIKGSANNNSYSLNDDEFRSFNQDVPDPIKNILRLNEINFQNQHDSHFWLSESAPVVSRELNKVIDLEIIDTSLSNIASKVRESNAVLAVCEDRLSRARQNVVDAEQDQVRITDFHALKRKREEVLALEASSQEIKSAVEEIASSQARELASKASELEILVETAKTVLTTSRRFWRLDAAITEMENLESQAPEPPSFGPITSKWHDVQRLEQTVYTLKRQISNMSREMDEVITAEKDLQFVQAYFDKTVKNQKCPLCGK